MNEDYRLRLENFIAAKLMALKLLKQNIIIDDDYQKIIKKLEEKYCIKDSVITCF